jgi:hypothetical protein
VRDACYSNDKYKTFKWRWNIHGQKVCECAFLWITGTSPRTLRHYKFLVSKHYREHNVIAPIEEQRRQERNEKNEKISTQLCLEIENWIMQWANAVGDRMPHEDKIRVPFFRWNAVYGEYCTAMKFSGKTSCSMKYFRNVWRHTIGNRVTLEKTYSNFAICDKCLGFQDDLARSKFVTYLLNVFFYIYCV